MSRCFDIKITSSTGQGTYTAYYDEVNSNNIGIVTSNSKIASGITFTDLTNGNGVNVTIPDCTSELILYNIQCSTGVTFTLPTSGFTIYYAFTNAAIGGYLQIKRNGTQILRSLLSYTGCTHGWNLGDTIDIIVDPGTGGGTHDMFTMGVNTYYDNQLTPNQSHITQTITEGGNIVASTLPLATTYNVSISQTDINQAIGNTTSIDNIVHFDYYNNLNSFVATSYTIAGIYNVCVKTGTIPHIYYYSNDIERATISYYTNTGDLCP